jgi:hypothetical protein
MALPPFPTMGNWFAGNDTPYNKSDTLLSVGLGLLSGKNAQDQVGQAASNFANNRQMGRTYNKTIEFLKQSNPELAQAVESGAIGPADAYKLYITSKAKADRPRTFQTLPDGTYGFADPDTGTFNPLGKAPKPTGSGPDGTGAYYGTTIPYYDAAGTLRYKQLGKDGNGKDVDFGGGVAAPPTKIFDTGTEGVILAPGGRQTGAIQKDVAGAANQKAVGEGQGAATVALPGVTQLATQIDQQVKDLKTDPYLPSMVGSVPHTGGMLRRDDLPDRSPESQRVRSKIDQLKGGSFLQARQVLKGGGAITDFEGQKADNAYNRMNTAQSLEDFNKALDDFNDAVKAGVAKLQQQSQGNFGGGQAPAAAPPGMASPGATSSGVKWSVEP